MASGAEICVPPRESSTGLERDLQLTPRGEIADPHSFLVAVSKRVVNAARNALKNSIPPKEIVLMAQAD
jgi:hypothetical protein